MSQSIVINNLEDLENIRNEIISFALEFDSIAQRKQYTIGDGENDICMLQCTDNSFTFNHVETVIKNSAQYHFDIIEQILAFINQK